MSFVELKIPPPLVALLVGVAMWGLAQLPPYLIVDQLARYIMSAIFAAVGVTFAVSGFIAFGRARTTIDPMHPGKTTALVSTGIYHYTRNPMYVGLWFVLLAWASYLQSLWAFLGTFVFVLWITYLQIIPEERVLGKLFGEEYDRYRARARRWL